MGTIRVARRARYTTVDRRTIRDHRLSFRARGVLLWLLDQPDGTGVDSEEIAAHGKEGRDAVRTAMAELRAHGYMRRRKIRSSGGRWVTETWVYERPQPVDEESTDDGFPVVGEPGVGTPVVGFPGARRNTDYVGTSKERENAPTPGTFAPTAEHLALADELNVDVHVERAKWIAWCQATARTYADLDAGFTLWLHRAHQAPARAQHPSTQRPTLELVRTQPAEWVCELGNPHCRNGLVDDPDRPHGTPVPRCECMAAVR